MNLPKAKGLEAKGRVARRLWAGSGLPESAVAKAVDAVERVRQSEFWNRVRTAEDRLTEVPQASVVQPDVSCLGIAKGVIDLALRFPDGWEIIDFKSDLGAIEQITAIYAEQVRTYAALWKEITGEHVRFAALFSTRALQISVDLQQVAATA